MHLVLVTGSKSVFVAADDLVRESTDIIHEDDS